MLLLIHADDWSEDEVAVKPSVAARAAAPGPMETLDRRISLSTDQLDTLNKRVNRANHNHRMRRINNNNNHSKNKNYYYHTEEDYDEDEDDEEDVARRARSAPRGIYSGNNHSAGLAMMAPSSNSSKSTNNNVLFNRGRTAAIKQRIMQGFSLKKDQGNDSDADSGPYSRRLFGPVSPAELEASATKVK